MCGIMAYIGKQEAYPILLKGLKKLEYRGYDSSGVAIMNGSLSLLKKEGKVNDLENFAISKKTSGNIGIGHTRWATHGIPSDSNAHPHQSQSKRLSIVHNGIIENHEKLRQMLTTCGYTFQSDTDTEVLVQLIEWLQDKYVLSTKESLARALEIVEGSFAIVLFDLNNPTTLLAARRQSPLALGIGNNCTYISSDAMPISEYTSDIIYVEDDIIIELDDKGNYGFCDLNLDTVQQQISLVEYESQDSEKGIYDSYMLKEIHEQPVKAKELIDTNMEFSFDTDIDRIVITACGSSWHSGLIAEYLIEKYARVNVEVEYASEFRYRHPVLSSKDLVIGISQSGETADTIAALKLAKSNNCKTLAFVNAENCTISRIVDQAFLLHAGAEIGVASTKAFTNQVVALTKFLVSILNANNPSLAIELSDALQSLPAHLERVVNATDINEIAEVMCEHSQALFLGRGSMFPVALEGALKLKEISYIHAGGYAAGEMKHGPIALIDENLPVIAFCNNDEHLPKVLSNIQEVKARDGIIIVVKSEDVILPKDLADYVIETPACHSVIAPIVQNIPLQLLAYKVASILNLDVDRPRNLAKSVTVE